MPWKFTANYVDPQTLGIEELAVVIAEWNPPGPGPERFPFPGLLFRTDILSANPAVPTTPRFQKFLDDATAAALEWQQSNTWSDADAGDVEAALEAALP